MTKTTFRNLKEEAYSNSEYGYKINLPKGWLEDYEKAKVLGTVMPISTLFKNNRPDHEGSNAFYSNISIIVHSPLDPDLDGLADYANIIKETNKMTCTDLETREEENEIINGHDAKILTTTFKSGVFNLRCIQLITVVDENGYIVTGTFLESERKKYQDLIESCLLSFDTKSDILEEEAYSCTDPDFEINPPIDWEPDEGGILGSLLALMNPEPDEVGKYSFRANIMVFANNQQVNSKLDSLDNYVKDVKKFNTLTYTYYNEIDEMPVIVNGNKSKLLVGTYTSGVFKLVFIELVTIKDSQGYVVLGQCLESEWDKYQDLFKSSLLTFNLK